MENQIKVPKRILSSLLASLSAGVVPRTGAPYVAIGRSDEIAALYKDFEAVADGGAFTRFIIGKYGSGKSFLIQLMRGYACERDFVCADADLSPERRLCATAGAGLATYKELIKNLSSKGATGGGALSQIIVRWLSDLQTDVAKEGTSPDNDNFSREVSKRIYAVMHEIETGVGAFDFARVISKYYDAYRTYDDETQANCLKWLRGEFRSKVEAREALGVNAVIDDRNWYDYIKLFAVFVRKIGYKGLIVFIDECVNLYKISNRISRENNYEKILSIYNDTLQGKAEGLGVIFAGTPQFLEDGRRGLFSYEALRSRLSDSIFAGSDSFNGLTITGPVIRLTQLGDDELLALLARITVLFSQYYGAVNVSAEDMKDFLYKMLDRAGAQSMMTPRELIRAYLAVLGALSADSAKKLSDVIGKVKKEEEKDNTGFDPDMIEI
ncbi:MAG: ATP-binding protein [Clostridia bacterium]|nr:ATP-binding protein [Clostridia bacterium]